MAYNSLVARIDVAIDDNQLDWWDIHCNIYSTENLVYVAKYQQDHYVYLNEVRVNTLISNYLDWGELDSVKFSVNIHNRQCRIGLKLYMNKEEESAEVELYLIVIDQINYSPLTQGMLNGLYLAMQEHRS